MTTALTLDTLEARDAVADCIAALRRWAKEGEAADPSERPGLERRIEGNVEGQKSCPPFAAAGE